MAVVRSTLWTVASAGAVWVGFNFFMLVLSDFWNVGGGVFHMVYAYTSPECPNIWAAAEAHNLYTLITCLLVAALVAVRVPVHWTILAVLSAAVGSWHWWQVCSFADDESVRTAFLRFLPYIPLSVFATGWVANRVVCLVRERGRTGNDEDH